MMPAEGTIRFSLDFAPGPAPRIEQVRELIAWHRILYRLHLTGQEPGRYGGMAFGNLSRRLSEGNQPSAPGAFVITGTQTAGKPILCASDYTLVKSFDTARNCLSAQGPVRPSSEALTHAAVYQSGPQIKAVFHVHSAEIWGKAKSSNLPTTCRQAEQGSVELALEVETMLSKEAVRAGGILILGGHEDGIITYGRTAEEAGLVLLQQLARAFQLSA